MIQSYKQPKYNTPKYKQWWTSEMLLDKVFTHDLLHFFACSLPQFNASFNQPSFTLHNQRQQRNMVVYIVTGLRTTSREMQEKQTGSFIMFTLCISNGKLLSLLFSLPLSSVHN